MVVYVELVLAENWCVDYFLLLLTARLTPCPAVRPGLGALLGGVYACVMPLWPLLAAWPVKLGSLMLMLLLSFGRMPWGTFFRSVLAMLGITGTLGGLVMLLRQDLLIDGMVYTDDVFFLPALLSAVLAFSLYRLLIPFFCSRKLQENTAILEIGGKKISAFFDSGNSLYYRNDPVILVEKTLLPELHGCPLIIPYASVREEGALLGFRVPDVRLLFNGHRQEFSCVVALADHGFGAFGALLHPDLIKETIV